ncbi:molybdenum cofactor sulfurase isoform X3 [Magnolia sinica]|uniref:molybdenum cofactor sulfurase isoform X3 n=1 Tax=Magnolia sinica TaxID=86752 RepID=UPI00265A54D3|nr:molybdenum cofactor sulfurase isoform X3 [Magnolia sinica]
MGERKEEFLKEFGEDYGYPHASKNIDEIRATEFKRLDELVYLDHAGATLYSESQMESVIKDLTTNVYGNPHSQSDSSVATSDNVRMARQQVLDYFNASPEDYKCIFTSGATAALKLVGEAFPWSRESCFMYTMENHNSVLGIREYALNQGATALAVDIEDVEHHSGPSKSKLSSFKVSQHPAQRRTEATLTGTVVNGDTLGTVYNLFAFPSECNFSGVRFGLDLVNIIKEDAKVILEGSPYCRGQWMVLIDAAKGCATHPPDLTMFPADFVVISFYKIFGYPTGLGALIVRTEAARLLRKTYFSGGTVAASIADIDFVRRRGGIEESFEDGTQSFLSIAAISHGFKIINTLTISSIARHTASLAVYVRSTLLALRHGNGASVCVLYGTNAAKVLSRDIGPTIAFNLKRSDGSWFGYREVEKLASLSGIQLRTGCFCNPGACSKYLGLSHSDLLLNVEAGHVCWDDNDILHGKPTGAVRISFGYMSTFEDAKKFISFVVRSFVSIPNPLGNECPQRTTISSSSTKGIERSRLMSLKAITIYPIKSCAGFSVDSWPLSSNGLQHDREWLLKSPSGEILTQKKVPEMCLIRTFIDLSRGTLFVESPRCKEKLKVPLEQTSCYRKEEMQLYGQRYEVQGYDSDVNLWFTEAIARPCTLMRCFGSEHTCCMNTSGIVGMCRDVQSKLNFVNEAQFLLVSEESISDLNKKLSKNPQNRSPGHQLPIHIDSMRFRPNLVISGAEPYAEDNWRNLTIGKACFTSLGGCNRCQMINLNPQTGQVQKLKEPLATLASYRRVQGKIFFGILLKYEENMRLGGWKDNDPEPRLQVGQRVYPNIS